MSIQGKKIVAIIQARMASSRLPGKVLKNICGKPMLAWVVERASRSEIIGEVVVATTIDSSDDPIMEYCHTEGITCMRGSGEDVLDRYYQVASFYKADVIVRITADCPFIDPGLIDKLLFAFDETGVDYATNRLPPPWGRTYPIGLDEEVCTMDALRRAWQEAEFPYQREHVMPYFYELAPVDEYQTYKQINRIWNVPAPRNFRVLLLNHDLNLGNLRWTVDTAEDLSLAQEIGRHFQCHDDFSWQEILHFTEQNPDIARINAHVEHKGFKDIDERQSKTRYRHQSGK